MAQYAHIATWGHFFGHDKKSGFFWTYIAKWLLNCLNRVDINNTWSIAEMNIPWYTFTDGKPGNIIYTLSKAIVCSLIPSKREPKAKKYSRSVRTHERPCLVADSSRTLRALSLRTIKWQWPQSNRLRLIARFSHFSRNFLLDLKSWRTVFETVLWKRLLKVYFQREMLAISSKCQFAGTIYFVYIV